MTSFAPDTRGGTHRLSPQSPSRWWMAPAVAVGLVCIIMTLAVTTWAGSPWRGNRAPDELISGAVFDAWSLSPHLGLLALLIIIAGRWPRMLGVALVLSLIYTGVTAWTLYDFVNSDSSTAAIVFVFLPVVLWGGVIAIGAITWMVGSVVGRIGRRRSAARART